MVVNVCPVGTATVTPDRVWSLLMAPERMGLWTDATFLRAEPAGATKPGQVIHLKARSLGRSWTVTIAIDGIDPQRQWIDMLVRMPFGIENHEHLTLTPTLEGGTLIRFN